MINSIEGSEQDINTFEKEKAELLERLNSDYFAGFERFLKKAPILSRFPLVIRCIVLGLLPFLFGLSLAYFTEELTEFTRHWIISNMTTMIFFSNIDIFDT